MDSLLIELAKKNELAQAGRRLDEILFRLTKNSPIKNKALNNIWMFLHHAELVPDNHEYKTSHIDLKQNKITINRSFLVDYIKNVNDLAFIVLRERHHIALRYLHEVDISRILYYQHDINISLQDFLEDTYINGIVRRSVDTDLPERFYGYYNEEKPGMERWLMHPRYFDIYTPNFDHYAATAEAKAYAMLCNIYQYASKSIKIKERNVSFKYWVQMTYAFFLKFLNEKQADKKNQEGESARENKRENPEGSDRETENGGSQSKSGGGGEEQKTGDNREGKTGGSGEFLYQPLSESGYDALQHGLSPEEAEFSEQTGHYHKSGGGAYYVSAQKIIPKTREWDASLITQTSENSTLDLNAQVMLDAKVMDGFMKAAQGLLVQANHRDMQMPFTYMPHRISRPDAFSLSMGAQPIFWQHQVEHVSKKHYAVYFDVSDSMLDYIGYLPCLLKALSGVDYTVYNFSRLVVEMHKHLCGRFYIGSGGTSYKAVAGHILANKFTHAFILTDGCGAVPKDMLPALRQQLQELIFIKLGDPPEASDWDFLATQTIEPG